MMRKMACGRNNTRQKRLRTTKGGGGVTSSMSSTGAGIARRNASKEGSWLAVSKGWWMERVGGAQVEAVLV